MIKKYLIYATVNLAIFSLQAEDLITKDLFIKRCEELKKEALNLGIASHIVDTVFESLSFKKDIIKKDSSQPATIESAETYIAQRVRPTRINFGRHFLRKNIAFFEPICKKFNIDFELLISLWAVETDFGTNMGKFDSFSGMATLMCTRRFDFFKKEFLTLLKLLNDGVVPSCNLVGEWAGAHGHFQFMPTTILKYGVDYDNDGVIDLKGSLQDAFASAANYMHVLGWKRGLPWGYEVILNQELSIDTISFSSRALKTKMSLQEWCDLGVIPLNSESINFLHLQAWLIMADGAENKYYVVFDNFKAVLRWNNSFKYGLMVCLLMDQIKG